MVSQLSSRGELLHAYLHALFLKDAHAASDFHEQQVSLYAQYDQKLLLPFLRQSMHYPLEKAYAVSMYNMTQVQVFCEHERYFDVL